MQALLDLRKNPRKPLHTRQKNLEIKEAQDLILVLSLVRLEIRKEIQMLRQGFIQIRL
jgi:hypothetical protein